MRFLARFCILCKADHGASLVELALVTPILFLLLMGAVDFGRAYYVGLEVADAAHAGAEYGSQNPSSTAGITAAARQSAPNLSNLTVTPPTWGCECSDGSSYTASCTTTPTCKETAIRGSNVVNRVQVTTSSAYTTVIPWPFIPSSITLSDTATVRGN
jgi:Flp pilus assembly protein TadG